MVLTGSVRLKLEVSVSVSVAESPGGVDCSVKREVVNDVGELSCDGMPNNASEAFSRAISSVPSNVGWPHPYRVPKASAGLLSTLLSFDSCNCRSV